MKVELRKNSEMIAVWVDCEFNYSKNKYNHATTHSLILLLRMLGLNGQV